MEESKTTPPAPSIIANTAGRSPASHLLQFFTSAHLAPRLGNVARPFEELAYFVAGLPASPEQTVALRKLLESKDCAVRCLVPADVVGAQHPPAASDRMRAALASAQDRIEKIAANMTLPPETREELHSIIEAIAYAREQRT